MTAFSLKLRASAPERRKAISYPFSPRFRSVSVALHVNWLVLNGGCPHKGRARGAKAARAVAKALGR